MKLNIIFILCFVSSGLVPTISKNIYTTNARLHGRIIHGMPAKDTEFPYMAAIWTTTDLGRYFCGGSAIDRQWILTSGYCVSNATSFTIQLGSISLSRTDSNRVTIVATKAIIHPDFNADTFANNIGLIYLPESLKYNDFINIIGLPTSSLTENKVLVTTGWGQTDDDHSGPVDALQRVIVISFPTDHCKNFYGNQITQNMVCAMGSYNEGTCIGDMGGPLIAFDEAEELPVHVGIASFISFNGCESLEPSGYERTFEHVDWIKQQIATFNYKN